MALTCRWRSRPQHHKQTLVLLPQNTKDWAAFIDAESALDLFQDLRLMRRSREKIMPDLSQHLGTATHYGAFIPGASFGVPDHGKDGRRRRD
jgi:hypothetical protein